MRFACCPDKWSISTASPLAGPPPGVSCFIAVTTSFTPAEYDAMDPEIQPLFAHLVKQRRRKGSISVEGQGVEEEGEDPDWRMPAAEEEQWNYIQAPNRETAAVVAAHVGEMIANGGTNDHILVRLPLPRPAL